jgi:competence protein ComEC
MSFIGEKSCIFFDSGGNLELNRSAIRYLQTQCFTKNNFLFISHYDADHIRKFKKINQILNLNKVYVPHLQPQTAMGRKFLEYFKKSGIQVEVISHFQEKIDDLEIKQIPHHSDKSENSKSLLLLLNYHGKKLLLTGDLQSTFEPAHLPFVDILKVGHHGSKYSTSKNTLANLKPKTCIISVGKNSYGHPNKDVCNRMMQVHCSILRTDTLGNIIFKF